MNHDVLCKYLLVIILCNKQALKSIKWMNFHEIEDLYLNDFAFALILYSEICMNNELSHVSSLTLQKLNSSKTEQSA